MNSMNRRTFTKLSALALAGLHQSSRAQASSKPVGYAAIGLGTISDIFMRACAGSSTSKITALVTGHPEKATKYAAMYGIPATSVYSYETFDRIRDNKDVDAVYVGLPNSMHCEYTERAAAAGKHVLCEKPMAISSKECQTMIDACKKASVRLMIAYRVQYDPTWMQVGEIVRSGAIGDVESFHGSFYGEMPQGQWRLDKKLGGGGPILDLGIYPLNTIRHILGEEPNEFTAEVSTREPGPRFAQVEQTMEWTMKFPSGISAACGCSYGAVGPASLEIFGSDGQLVIEPAFYYEGLKVRGETYSRSKGQGGKKPVDIVSPGKAPYQFTLEADHFSDCVRRNVQPRSPGEEGLKDMLAIEAIYRAAGHPIA